MTYHVKSYAAHSPTSRLGLFEFDRRSPRADDVVIEILYCGVCHSDVHNVRNDWGNAQYPMVPGHEIVGRVLAVGPEVTRFKAGDRVGVGCLVESCRTCKACGKGLEQYCENGATYTYNATDPVDGTCTHGGYSEKVVVAEHFGIHSDIEVIRIQDINEAYERMLKADVKYRFVIDMASLNDEKGLQGAKGEVAA